MMSVWVAGVAGVDRRRFVVDLPALEGIHELTRRVEAFAHERGLLANRDQGILEQAGLVFRRSWRGHLVELWAIVAG